ncbi:lipopolysaccharide biosynthesis protein [Phocaeicola sartorii]|uniref:lipopolysaccharide biosynthesis protein n=1 Tax=Phocaeicola sartorii TaxID=671267 RepID=UPI001362E2D6|nr:oligosaccharide flippase family protein [Phocaeicola sartorii]NBH68315.1 hypothetical protein [Phocaeicola sartorii]
MSLVKNSLLYIISTLSVKAASFLLLPFYSYLVTPAEYGYVFVVSAFVSFMSIFMAFSLHGALSRFYFDCESKEEVRQLYSTIVLVIFLLSLSLSGSLFLLSNTLSEILNLPVKYFQYAVCISFVSTFYNVVLSLLYSMQDAKRVSITSTVLGILGIVIQLSMVLLMENKSLAIIQTMMINAVISFIMFCWYSIPYFTTPSVKLKKLKLYAKYSISQFPSDISAWFVQLSDRLIINKYIGAFDAGIYGMAGQLGQVPQILFHSVNKAYAPFAFSKYKEYEAGDELALGDMAKSTTVVFSILTGLIACIIVVSNNLIALLARQYATVAIVLPFILFAIWIDCLRILFMYPLAYMVKFIKVKSIIWIIGAIMGVSLNLILIPRYSVYGACVSMIVAYSFTCFLILYFAQRAIYINYDKRKLRLILFVTVLFLFFYFIGDNLLAFAIKTMACMGYIYIVVFKCNNIDVKRLWQNFVLQILKIVS